MCNSFSHDIESQNHIKMRTYWSICSRLNNNREVTLHTFGFHVSRPCLPLLLNQRDHRDKGEATYIKISFYSAGSVVQFSKKKPRPKDCRGFQNTIRIVMGSTPAYSPFVRHGDEIIITIK
jgi:hypothetical protein